MAALGYVLAHVLEVVVPGRDLGDTPSCEVSLGGRLVTCPVPSTLQSENVALVLPGLDGDPMLQISVFDSERKSVGVVVVPVATLAPTEIWNVWYAMDDGDDEEEPERLPEETPKMHLLLQHVSAEAAAVEAPQAREMRAQDFLLRALQQLNTALEQKMAVHGATAAVVAEPPSGLPPAPPGPAKPGTPGARPVQRLGASSSEPAFQQLPSSSSMQACLGSPSPARACDVEAAQQQAEQAATTALWRKQLDEAVQRRVEPFERITAALEARQRFYDDQELRVQQLSAALEAQEVQVHDLSARLLKASQEAAAEIEAEREIARQTEGDRGGIEMRIVELQNQLAAKHTQEETLQRRNVLMESELAASHEKCKLLDAAQEEVTRQRSSAGEFEERYAKLEAGLASAHGQQRAAEAAATEAKEALGRQLAEEKRRMLDETRSAEVLRQSLLKHQDEAHDREVASKLEAERVEALDRQLQTQTTEADSLRRSLERERAHRIEADRKLEEQELQPFRSQLEEHCRTVARLREELATAQREVHDERTRGSSLDRQLVEARSAADREARRAEEASRQLVAQEELRETIAALRKRETQLEEQLRAGRQETRRMADHYERELGEHARSELALCQERDESQRQVADLQLRISAAEQRHRELELARDQLSRSLEATAEPLAHAEHLQGRVAEAQEELSKQRAQRQALGNELDRAVAQFKQQALDADRRGAELEGVLDDRNNEIKLLMYRVQELSSNYSAHKGDLVDQVLSKWVNGYRPAVPFFRLGPGLYLFGRRQVSCKIANEKPVFRVGGGFVAFDKFLELYASDELERLLDYELDERTGEPMFAEALRASAGALDDLREREQAGRRGSPDDPNNFGRRSPSGREIAHGRSFR